MDLKAIVVHRLDKERNGNATVSLRDSLLPINETEQEFISSVNSVYYKKSNPTYGVFDPNTTSFPFQNMLRSYLENGDDFLKFSRNAMDHFRIVINDVTQATGGYVVFAHIETSQEFVLTVMLNSKKQFNINDDLSIEEILSLDIEKLDVANFVNISKWEDEEDTYLSFARGRKDITNYFRRFIGCTDQSSAKQSSKRFKRAVLDYLNNELKIERDEIEDIRNQIFNYCTQKIKRKEDISLSHVSSMMDEENPKLFQEFAAREEYQVSPYVKGHKGTLKSLKFYVYRSKDLTIEFDSCLLNDRIAYDSNINELTIREVPDDLRQQILNMQTEEVED